MTDREKRTLKDGVKNLIVKYKALEHGIIEVLENNILSFIDSMQEEPVSIWHDIEELPIARECEYILVIYKDTTTPHVAGNKTQVSYWDRVDKWAYFDDVLKLSNVKRTTKNWKEPISEDLSEYINELSKQFPEVSFAKLSRIAVRVAKWQREQDQSTIELAEDHAMLAGMEKMKEEMMAKAIDAELYSDGMLTPIIKVNDKEKISDIKFGDEVKVIVIKKD